MRKKIVYNLANSVHIYEDEILKYPIPEVNEININLSSITKLLEA